MAKRGKTEAQKSEAPTKALATAPAKALAKKSGGGQIAGEGFESIEMSDILMPRLKLTQNGSPEVVAKTVKPGSIILALSGEDYGSKVTITPIRHFRSRIKWNDRDDGGGIDCSAPDAVTPRDTKYAATCAECKHAEWDNEAKNKRDQAPSCTLYDNFMVLINDSREPVILPMERTKAKVARKIYSMGALKGGNMRDWQYVLKVVEEKNSESQPYFNYQVDPSPKKTPEALVKVAAEIFTNTKGKVVSEVNQEQEGASAGAPAAAPAGRY
jgi:hypothetical protein